MRWLSVDQIAPLTRDADHQRRHAAEARRLPRGAAAWREARTHSAREEASSMPDLLQAKIAYGTEVMVA